MRNFACTAILLQRATHAGIGSLSRRQRSYGETSSISPDTRKGVPNEW